MADTVEEPSSMCFLSRSSLVLSSWVTLAGGLLEKKKNGKYMVSKYNHLLGV